MTRGLYLTQEGGVMVDYDSHQAPLPGDMYVTAGYRPALEELPTHEQYNFAQREADKVRFDIEIRNFREATNKSFVSERLGDAWKRLRINYGT